MQKLIESVKIILHQDENDLPDDEEDEDDDDDDDNQLETQDDDDNDKDDEVSLSLKLQTLISFPIFATFVVDILYSFARIGPAFSLHLQYR